eukprot:g813.t1
MPVVVDASGKWSQDDDERLRERLQLQDHGSRTRSEGATAGPAFFVYDSLLRVSGACVKRAAGGGKRRAWEEEAQEEVSSQRALHHLPRLLCPIPAAPAATCAVLMLAAGDFAAATLSLEPPTQAAAKRAAAGRWPAAGAQAAELEKWRPRAVLHRTARRYTTRRKAGGSQSAADNRNGAHKSAGATLRRYNERALTETVAAIVAEWADALRSCAVIVLCASSRSRSTLYAAAEAAGKARAKGGFRPPAAADGAAPLFADTVPQELPFGKEGADPRVVRPSFPTAKPSLEECRRIGAMLCAVHFVPFEAGCHAGRAPQASASARGGEPVGNAARPLGGGPGADAGADAGVAAPGVGAGARASRHAAEVHNAPPAWQPSALFVACASGDAGALAVKLAELRVAYADDIADADAEADGGAALAAALAERVPALESLGTLAGATPLHLAAARGGAAGERCVTLLLESGADPCALDYSERSPYKVCGGGTAQLMVLAGAAATAAAGGVGGGAEEHAPAPADGASADAGTSADEPENSWRGNARPVQQAFRVFRGCDGMEERHDWGAAGVPEAVTADSAEAKRQKEAEKRRRKKARQKEARKAKKAAAAAQESAATQKQAAAAAAAAAEEAAAAAGNACDGCGRGMPPGFQPLERLQFRYCCSACVVRHKRQLAVDAAERRQKLGQQ